MELFIEKGYKFKRIDYTTATNFLITKHYSGRKPQIKFAFGLYRDGFLISVCTFGVPASASLCIGVCGKEYKDIVLELNRLLSIETNKDYPLSKFVSMCLKDIRKIGDFVIVSYSDTEMSHNGYIYQACNFIYTGCTKPRTDKYTVGNKHSRHYDKSQDNSKRKLRSAKHRYIFFCTKKREIINSLKYQKQDYPKGENKRYVLGEYLKPKFILK